MLLNDAEERLALMRASRLKIQERYEKLNKMPWIKRLQEPECKEQLEELETHQKEAFLKMVKREKIIDDPLELFSLFFNDLLCGRVKSMREWIIKDKYLPKDHKWAYNGIGDQHGN